MEWNKISKLLSAKREPNPEDFHASPSSASKNSQNLITSQENPGAMTDASKPPPAEEMLRRAHRALEVLAECNQVLVRASREDELIQKICEILVETGGYRMAWVGLPKTDNKKSFQSLAQAGYLESYLEKTIITWDETIHGRGPTGTAFRTRQPAITRDTATDPDFAPWRKAAIQRGYASTIALPINIDAQPWGVLTIHAPEADAFDSEEIQLLAELADDLAFGISALRARAAHDRMQAELQEKTEQLTLITDGLPAIIAHIDAKERYLHVNRAYAEWFGRQKEEIIGKTVREVIGELAYKGSKPQIERVLKGKMVTFENKAIDKNGEEHIVSATFVPHLDDRGSVKAYFALVQNISERRRSEAALRESEHKYRTLFESSTDGVFLMKDVYLDCNEQACRIWGCSRQEIIGKTPADFSPPDQPDGSNSKEAAQRKIKAAMQGAPQFFYWQHRHKDGHLIDAEISLKAVTVNNETMILATLRDITERKRAEDALRWEMSVNAALSDLYAPLISPQSAIKDIAETVLQHAKRITDSRHGFVSSIDPKSGKNTSLALAPLMQNPFLPEGEKQQLSVSPGKDGLYPGLCGFALNTRQAFYTNTPAQHPAAEKTPSTQPAIQNFLSAPVLLGAELVGQLTLANSSRAYTDQDLKAIQRLVDFYALALQRLRTEEALQSSEQRMRLIVENLPIGAVYREDERIFPNKAAEEITGYPRCETPTVDRWFKAIYGSQWKAAYDKYQEDRKGGFPEPRTIPLKSKGGQERLVEYTGIAYEQGEIWLMSDITERKKAEKALRESEEQYRRLFSDAVLGIFRSTLEGDLISVNPAYARMFGYQTPEEVINAMNAVNPTRRRDIMRRIIETRGPIQLEEQYQRKDGGLFTANLHAWTIRDASDRILFIEGFIEDITERKIAEEALRESEERYALAVRGANDGIWDWDLRANRIYYSPRWQTMLGYKEMGISDSPNEWFNRIHPEDREKVQADITAHMSGITPHFENEHRIQHRDGSYRWFLARGLAVRDPGRKAHRIAGSLTDITNRKTTEERLRHDTMHDPLTNLPNRVYFMDQLRRAIERTKRHSNYVAAVLFMDLDRFKIVNDSLGHASGDQMLVSIAKRLEACLRPDDTIARFGGDEFAILIEDIKGVNDAIRVADRIQRKLIQPVALQGHEVFATASIGIALTTSVNYDRPEEMIRDADTAMYRAKAGGRARHQIFDTEMHTRTLALLHLEGELRKAIERHEFRVYYQPIVSIADGKISAVEALLRWQHPERGLILPSEFIGLAEETGLIVPIGEWVLNNVGGQAKIWSNAGLTDLRLSINISAHQLQDPNLLAIIQRVLAGSDMPTWSLKLEITESAAMRDFDLTIQILRNLHGSGVQISIDDFGTSYSSLGYLKRFPVSSLKIDQSFIKDIGKNKDNDALVTAIIAMGHILNVRIIAEGVETKEQLDFLASQQCDEVQGFLISKPQSAEEITELLSAGRPLLPVIETP